MSIDECYPVTQGIAQHSDQNNPQKELLQRYFAMAPVRQSSAILEGTVRVWATAGFLVTSDDRRRCLYLMNCAFLSLLYHCSLDFAAVELDGGRSDQRRSRIRSFQRLPAAGATAESNRSVVSPTTRLVVPEEVSQNADGPGTHSWNNLCLCGT